MIKIGNIILSLLTALMVVACSPGGGDVPSPGPYDDNSKPMDNIPLNSFYEGVWMVNGAEPGIRHYFNNGSSISNFYKDKPTNFNLQLGLRFDF